MKTKLSIAALCFGGLATLTACGGSSNDAATTPTTTGPTQTSAATSAASANPQDIVDALAALPTSGKVSQLTEDNDSNNLLGRPNGYSAAWVINVDGATCSNGPGVDCGAVVEVWPDEQSANDRKDYIQGILKKSPMLGTEYDVVRDGWLLRVSGQVKPSVEKKYEAAFTG